MEKKKYDSEIVIINPPFNRFVNLDMEYVLSYLNKNFQLVDLNIIADEKKIFNSILEETKLLSRLTREGNYKEIFDDKNLSKSTILSEFFLNKFVKSNTKALIFIIADDSLSTINKQSGLFSLFLSRYIKKRFPKIKIVFGGKEAYYKNNGKFFLKTGYVDYIINGDSKKIINDIISQLKKGLVKKKGVLSKNSKKNLSTESFEWCNKIKIPSIHNWKYYQKKINIMPISASKGCPHICNFCVEGRKKYRTRSAENIYKELKIRVEKYRVKNFFFTDLNFNVNKKNIKNLCNLIIKNKLKINWGCQFRIDKTFDKELIKKMRQAGCKFLFLGLESGSDDLLQKMNKLSDTKTYIKALQLLKKLGFWIHVNFIIGYPGETKKDFIKTIEFVWKNEKYMDNIHFQPFMLFPELRSRFNLDIEKIKLRSKKKNKIGNLYNNVRFADITQKEQIINSIFKNYDNETNNCIDIKDSNILFKNKYDFGFKKKNFLF